MMEPSSSNDSGAVVGRAENLAWFDTMPVSGWPSGCTA